MKAAVRILVVVCCIVASGLVFSRAARAQAPVAPAGDPDQNKKLRVQLDRATIRAFEPVYLCLTAEQFAFGADPQVQVQSDNGEWQSLAIDKKEWMKSETAGSGPLPVRRMGVVLQTQPRPKPADGSAPTTPPVWLFAAAGDYHIRVKIGSDSTTLNLTVTAPEPGEQQAWDTVADHLDDLINNNFGDAPSQTTIDLCAKVIRKYPKTLCAAYCQSYISISKFKLLFDKNVKSGGKAVYGTIAEELDKVAAAFHDGFFGEMTAFYAAYAKGLSKDFGGLLTIIENMKTHVTPWSDGVIGMKFEVLSHLAPRAIPLDPDDPRASTTRPSGVPLSATHPTTAPVIITPAPGKP